MPQPCENRRPMFESIFSSIYIGAIKVTIPDGTQLFSFFGYDLPIFVTALYRCFLIETPKAGVAGKGIGAALLQKRGFFEGLTGEIQAVSSQIRAVWLAEYDLPARDRPYRDRETVPSV